MRLLFRDTLVPLHRALRSPRWRDFYRLHRQLAHRPRFSATRTRLLGADIRVPDGPSLVWQYKDIFVDEIYRRVSYAAQPVILDCGANIGLSVLYFVKLHPHAQITAYEADLSIIAVLEHNLRAWGVTDVRLVPKAVWIDESGVSFVSQGADGGSVMRPGVGDTVATVRLRDEIDKYAQVDLLKMDIEGAETAVLLDCQPVLKRVQHLFVEYHSFREQPQRLDELLSLLQSSGFRYHLTAETDRLHPFIDDCSNSLMDCRVNIFASR